MINERLQVLLTSEQRRRLEREARRQGRSVASLIRDAIDARFGYPSPEERLAAFEAIRGMGGDPALRPSELRRAIDESHQDQIQRGVPRPA